MFIAPAELLRTGEAVYRYWTRKRELSTKNHQLMPITPNSSSVPSSNVAARGARTPTETSGRCWTTIRRLRLNHSIAVIESRSECIFVK